MYEIASDGFIVQPRKGDGVYLFLGFWSSREIWERKTYSEASAISLKNATLLAQELPTASSHGSDNSNTVDEELGEVQSSREWAEKLLGEDSEGNFGLVLSLLEDAAIHGRDIGSLAMAISVILRNRSEQGSWEYPAVNTALDLLEKFYTCETCVQGRPGEPRTIYQCFWPTRNM